MRRKSIRQKEDDMTINVESRKGLSVGDEVRIVGPDLECGCDTGDCGEGDSCPGWVEEMRALVGKTFVVTGIELEDADDQIPFFETELEDGRAFYWLREWLRPVEDEALEDSRDDLQMDWEETSRLLTKQVATLQERLAVFRKNSAVHAQDLRLARAAHASSSAEARHNRSLAETWKQLLDVLEKEKSEIQNELERQTSLLKTAQDELAALARRGDEPQPGDMVYDKITGERGVLTRENDVDVPVGGTVMRRSDRVLVYRGGKVSRDSRTNGFTTVHDSVYLECLTTTRPKKTWVRPFVTHALVAASAATGTFVGILWGLL